MKGGFFINVDISRIDEIRDLRRDIARDRRASLDLADGVKKAEELLRARATG